MVRGRLNKAQRGDLLWNLPVGLEYDVLGGQIQLVPDQSVRHAVALAFRLFRVWLTLTHHFRTRKRENTSCAIYSRYDSGMLDRKVFAESSLQRKYWPSFPCGLPLLLVYYFSRREECGAFFVRLTVLYLPARVSG